MLHCMWKTVSTLIAVHRNLLPLILPGIDLIMLSIVFTGILFSVSLTLTTYC